MEKTNRLHALTKWAIGSDNIWNHFFQSDSLYEWGVAREREREKERWEGRGGEECTQKIDPAQQAHKQLDKLELKKLTQLEMIFNINMKLNKKLIVLQALCIWNKIE